MAAYHAHSTEPANVICFHCRKPDCACLKPTPELRPRHELIWALAWLGGACAAGTALGAALAFLVG
jgi:hypothetical protein